MRQSVLALAVFVSLMIPAKPSFAEWVEVWKTLSGSETIYIDTKIRKHDGHIYFWSLTNYLEPMLVGSSTLSVKEYFEVDCGKSYRLLEAHFYTEPMGRGAPNHSSARRKWIYLPTYSSLGKVICEKACDMAKNQ